MARLRFFHQLSIVTVYLFCLLCFCPHFSLADTEPNNTSDFPTLLNLDTVVSGTVNGASDPKDWYQVNVGADGELTITVTHDPSDFQFILYGADEENDIIGTETNAPSGRQLVRTVQQGTYLIQVNSRYHSTPVAYTIIAELDPAPAATEDTEPNDSVATADRLTLNTVQTGHISYTLDDASIDNKDYYLVEIPEDAEVTFSFEHDPPDDDFQFILYGSDGLTMILGTETNLHSGESRTRSLAAGTYFLAVNGRGNTQGRTYQFSVTTDSAPPVTQDIENNDTFETASDLTLNVEQTGHISFTRDDDIVDNRDHYQLVIPQAGDVTFTFIHEPEGFDFQFVVLAEDGETILFSTQTNFPSGDSRTADFEAGSYILRVDGRGETQGRTYVLTVTTGDQESECSSDSLEQCTNQTECIEAGGNWCDQDLICQAEECPSDEEPVVIPSNCEIATLSQELGIFLPVMRYDTGGSIMNLWVELRFTPIGNRLFFAVVDFGSVEAPPAECEVTTLSPELTMHIPRIGFQGPTMLISSFWADLVYTPSDDGILFELVDAGIVETLSPEVDNDGDGFRGIDGDCNDYNPEIYPGAEETANDGVDQDCIPTIFD